jgi:hypothetical protein
MPYWVTLAIVSLVLFFSKLQSIQLTFKDDEKPQHRLKKGGRRRQLEP